MNIFFVVWIALLAYPVFIVLIFIPLTKNKPVFRKSIAALCVVASMVITLCAGFDISTTSQLVNMLLLSLLYFTVVLLLVLAYKIPKLPAKILSGIFLFIVLAFGYTLATVGILGLGFIAEDIKVDRIIHLSDKFTYKQYNRGNALDDYRGIEIDICEKYQWLPFLEKVVFNKYYSRSFDAKLPQDTINKHPVLHSNNFKVQYPANSKELILLDSVKQDTIRW